MNERKSIYPQCGHNLPEDKGKPRVKLVDGKWVRYCKECGWRADPE